MSYLQKTFKTDLLTKRQINKSVFSDRVICGDCGSSFGPKLWHASDKYRTTVWQCNKKFNKN